MVGISPISLLSLLISLLSLQSGATHSIVSLARPGCKQYFSMIILPRGYGYWAPYLLDLQETDPGCGLEEFNRVVDEYSYVTDIYSTYGQDVTAAAYTSGHPDDRPEVLILT